MLPGIIGELQRALKQLPGIGEKTAQRLAFHMIDQGRDTAVAIIDSIDRALRAYRNCSVCNMLAETDPCRFCSSPDRDIRQLCVVQHSSDVALVDNTGEYKGRFFVLGNLLSPINGIGPEQIRFPQLMRLLSEPGIEELILALNPSTEGESTIHYIVHHLQGKNYRITRLSTGLPFGSDLEYTSPITLANALQRRYPIH